MSSLDDSPVDQSGRRRWSVGSGQAANCTKYDRGRSRQRLLVAPFAVLRVKARSNRLAEANVCASSRCILGVRKQLTSGRPLRPGAVEAARRRVMPLSSDWSSRSKPGSEADQVCVLRSNLRYSK